MNPASTSQPRILVVEGEPIASGILSDLLRMAGYEAVCAGTGEQALLTLMRERGRIDAVFTEVELPGLVDGWMVAEEFRSARPAGPIVFAARPGSEAQIGAGTAVVASPVLPPKVVEALATLDGKVQEVARSRCALREIVEARSEEAIGSAGPSVVEGPQRVRATG